MQLITIKESHNISDFAIIQSRLDPEGIKCFVDGELTAQVLSHIPTMQAKLKILKSDFEKAKVILIENGELESGKKEIVRPKCGYEKCRAKRSLKESWRLVASVFMTLITFVSVNNSYHPASFVCERCEHEFSN